MLQRNKHLLFILLFLGFNLSVKAQNKPVELAGLVKFDSIGLQDITIANLTTRKGTYSSKGGTFTILASEGDSLKFTSLAYIHRKIVITNKHIKNKAITVFLEPNVNQLEEVFLKGYTKLNVGNISTLPNTHFDLDEKSIKHAPDMSKVVDPTRANTGINFISIFKMLTKKLRSKKRAKREKEKLIAQQKKLFAYKLRTNLGDDFFSTWLHIRKNKINLFLDYCIGNGLEEYYDKDKIYLTNFLVKQSKTFNSIEK